jgi:DNA polymerase III subunit beta
VKFTVSKTKLLRELGFIQGVVERKSSIPILSNLLIEAKDNQLTLKGTDLDVSLSTTCDAEILVEGAICIQAKKLFEIVRALPEAEISVDQDAPGQLTLLCERSKFKILGLAKDNFPEIVEYKKSLAYLPAGIFQSFVASTVFAVTNEESRYALNGAKFELSSKGIRLVATDGHRLSFIEKEGDFSTDADIDTIIPKKTLVELLKLSSEPDETIEFGKDSGHLFFKVGKRILISKLLNGQFPNYEMVLPKDNKSKFEIESDRLSAAVKRVALMADERSHTIKFEVSADQLMITAHTSELGEAGEVLPISYSDEKITAGFNASYLNDFFGVTQGHKLSLELRDGNSQVLFRPVGDLEYDFRYVVMPMRL